MERRFSADEILRKFEQHLILEEKSKATIEKYIRDAKAFLSRIPGEAIGKEAILEYKNYLINSGYAVSSINSMLASLNSLFMFMGRPDLRIRTIKIQKQVFCPKEKMLTKEEYERLCAAAGRKGNERLLLILQTICATGIRVSELQYITVESIRKGEAVVYSKAKIRTVFLVKALRRRLLSYVKKHGINSGPVFITRNGSLINRVSVWREMKNLCEAACVDPGKVFPHNLRHLFARTFYRLEKDIARLADILGHSSIETTRIYIISTGAEHRRKMEEMRLVL